MQIIPEAEELELLEEEEQSNRTYKIDFEKNRITEIIDDIEAIKQTIYCILNTERYENIIYTWNYGSELKNLIGKDKDFILGDLKRRIIDALSIDNRIHSIENMDVVVEKNAMIVDFIVKTIYGDITIEQEVTI